MENVPLIMNNGWGHKEIIRGGQKRHEPRSDGFGDTQGKLKRTKRDRETKDREWVSVSEIRPVLSTVQRSKAECEFEISWEENIKLWQHLSHARGPEEIKSYTQQSHAAQARLSLPSLSTFSHFRLEIKVTKDILWSHSDATRERFSPISW